MASRVTFDDVLWLYHETEYQSRVKRRFRLSSATRDDLKLDDRWKPPHEFILGRPLVIDDAVPDGAIDFEMILLRDAASRRRGASPGGRGLRPLGVLHLAPALPALRQAQASLPVLPWSPKGEIVIHAAHSLSSALRARSQLDGTKCE